MSYLKNIFYKTCKYCTVLVCIGVLCAQTSPAHEYQLKAVFLFNFSQFTKWPANSFPAQSSPLIIGVLGADPFGEALELAVANESVNGHPLSIRRYNQVKDVGLCHILFIAYNDKELLRQTFRALEGKNVLTVGDAPGFIEQGGMIRFVNENGKIRFQINAEKTRGENLLLSSKLLRLAEIVSPQTGVQ
jgi:hypothetical protein